MAALEDHQDLLNAAYALVAFSKEAHQANFTPDKAAEQRNENLGMKDASDEGPNDNHSTIVIDSDDEGSEHCTPKTTHSGSKRVRARRVIKNAIDRLQIDNKPTKRRGPRAEGSAWTKQEEAKAIKAMRTTIDAGVKGDNRWQCMALLLKDVGVERAAGGIKAAWNRKLRAQSGLDERAPLPFGVRNMVTGTQFSKKRH